MSHSLLADPDNHSQYYRLYGLNLRSNLVLPGLESSSTSTTDIDIQFGSRPSRDEAEEECERNWYSSTYLCEDGRPNLEVTKSKSGLFHYRYGDNTEFWIDGTGKQIWTTWSEDLTLEDTVTYLVGPVFGFVLRLRGNTCLHASAVAVDEYAVALVGPTGAGKSTAAATFVSLGYSVLSEDVVALFESNGKLSVQSGYPRIRLWPEAIETPYGSPDSLPKLTPNWEKRYLDISSGSSDFHATPLPLGAVYVLGERSADSKAPFIEDLPANTRLVALVTNTYTNYMLSPSMRASEFELLGRIANTLPIRKVTPHVHPRHVGKLCDVIIEDFRRSSRTAL